MCKIKKSGTQAGFLTARKLLNQKTGAVDCEYAERDAEHHIGQRDDRTSACEQLMGFDRKCRKSSESAADANLEKQDGARVEIRRSSGDGDNKTECKCTKDVDGERDEGEAALVPDRNETDEIAQYGADHAAKADEYAIE